MEQILPASEALVTQGNLLREQKKFKQATSIYIDAIKLDLNNYLAFYHLGLCLAQEERLNEAISFYYYVTNINPDFPQSYYALGEVFSKQKQFEKAIACYQKSIQLNPSQHTYYMGLGKALKILGNHAQALKCFQKAISLKPNLSWAYIQSGAIWRQQSNYIEAVECYLKAIQINPNLLAAYKILEFIPISESQLARLIAVYQKIIEANPHIYHAWANLGQAFTQKKELALAINCYQQASYYQTIASYPQLAQSYTKTSNQIEPNFIIIGAGKCGTTSLYQYLSQHPQALAPIDKEINFFNFNFEQGKDWYLAHFPNFQDNQNFVTGEASPSYFSCLNVDRRIHKLFPQIKLIISLRNPIERVVSHYFHRVREGAEKRSLEAALNSELKAIRQATEAQLSHLKGYLGISIYVYKLKRWLSLFPPERVLILRSEDLYQKTSATMSTTYNFLNISEQKVSQYNRHNSGSYRLENDNFKLQLSRFFQPYNQQLETLLDRQFNWH